MNLVKPHHIERAVNANLDSMKGVTPRFIARTLGVGIMEVIKIFKRLRKEGKCERYSIKGEWYYRRPTSSTSPKADRTGTP